MCFTSKFHPKQVEQPPHHATPSTPKLTTTISIHLVPKPNSFRINQMLPTSQPSHVLSCTQLPRANEETSDTQSQLMSPTENDTTSRAPDATVSSSQASGNSSSETGEALDELNAEVKSKELAVLSTPPNHVGRANHLHNLSIALLNRHNVTGQIDDLSTGIKNAELAVESAPDETSRGLYLHALAGAIQTRYFQSMLIEDLDAEIRLLEKATQSTPSDDCKSKAVCLQDLGRALRARFDMTQCKEDINSAVAAHSEVVELMQEHDADDRAIALSDLGLALKARLQQSSLIDGPALKAGLEPKDDLGTLITLFREAIHLNSGDNPSQAMFWYNLGMGLFWRYKERPSSTQDLDEAIEAYCAAMQLLEKTSPNRPIALFDYALALEARFEETGSTDDLDDEIRALEKAAESAVDDFPSRAEFLHRLGNVLHARFDLNHDMQDLDASVKARQEAVKLTPVDNQDRGAPLADLGYGLLERYEITAAEEDLNDAIDAYREATHAISTNQQLHIMCLNSISYALRIQFERTGEMDSLEDAITLTKDLLDLPLDNGQRAATLNNLGILLQNMFESTGSLATLEEAIEIHQASTAVSPKWDSSSLVHLSGFSEALRKRHDVLGSMEDLNKAIELGEEVIGHSELDRIHASQYPLMLTNHGMALIKRYELLGRVDDLEKSVKYCKSAADQPSTNVQSLALCSNSLSYCLQVRYQCTGSVSDIDEAVKMSKRALSTITAQDQRRPTFQSNLCQSSMRQLRHKGTMDEDLQELFEMTERMVESVPQGHPNRSMVLNSRSMVVLEMFWRTKSTDYLDALVEACREAVAASESKNSETQASYLREMAEALLVRFERIGESGDLSAAVESAEWAVERISQIHPQYAVFLITRGRCICHRGVHTGSVDDINSSIKILEEAGRLLPEQHPERARCLNNLATSLCVRFSVIGTTDDLNSAIQSIMNSIKSLPAGNQDTAICLSNLGQILAQRFSRTRRKDDIDIAVEVHSRALDITAKDHELYAVCLDNLSSALVMRYYESRCLRDLQLAVSRRREALPLVPEDGPERARHCTNFSVALLEMAKAQGTGSTMEGLLDEAVATSKSAVALTLDTSPRRAEMLLNYGSCLETRFERMDSDADKAEAVKAYEEALGLFICPVQARIISAVRAAQLLYPRDIQRASRTLALAVELLPRSSSHTLLRNDQQFVLSQFHDLGANAAALSFRVGKSVDEAIRLLELGRGVIASLYFSGRTEVTVLEETHPELARRLKLVREEVGRDEHHFFLPGVKSYLHSQAAGRYDASKEFEEVVATIRQRPGFDRFLLGPTSAELKTFASAGPIVYLNASRFGCDALIITAQDIQHLPLSKLSYSELESKAKELSDIRDKDDPISRRHSNARLGKIVEWLWDVAVEEILDRLGFTEMPGDNDVWPKIWWIPVGLLSLFPIHAAGRRANGAGAIDRVISCYAPTARALGHARDRLSTLITLKARPETPKAVLVSMSTTPQRTDLRFAAEEIKRIDELLPFEKATLHQPTKKQVIEAIQHCSIIHFACHGEMDLNPSFSRILFTDWETDPFLVQDMNRANLGHEAQLAYLSACHAGSSKDMFLLDEAMHMTGACHLAGFPSVVGTLWQAMDEYAPLVAQDVYHAMLMEGTLNIREAARGLHFALRRIKTLAEKPRRKDNPWAWAPYIYVGV